MLLLHHQEEKLNFPALLYAHSNAAYLFPFHSLIPQNYFYESLAL